MFHCGKLHTRTPHLYSIPALLLLCQLVGESVSTGLQLPDVILAVSRLLHILFLL